MPEVVVMSDAPSHMLPDVLLWVHLRCVSREELDLNPMVMLLQELSHGSCLMGLVIVEEQVHFALRMAGQLVGPRDGRQQSSKANVVAAAMDDVQGLTGQRIDRAKVPALLCPHAWCENHSLLTNASPAAGDRWQCADLRRVAQEHNMILVRQGDQLTEPFFSPPPAQDPAYA